MLESLYHLAETVAIVVGATWVVAARLGKIDTSIQGVKAAIESHIATDKIEHKDQEARIVDLEKARRRARR
jgi:hypothetical protein